MIVNQQSLRGIYVGFNTLFNKSFEEVAPLYTEVATVTPSTTDSETYAWLGDIPGMREWIGDREIQNLSASDYTIKNKDFELTVGVDRNAIEDDKIGLYNPSVQMLGQSQQFTPTSSSSPCWRAASRKSATTDSPFSLTPTRSARRPSPTRPPPSSPWSPTSRPAPP